MAVMGYGGVPATSECTGNLENALGSFLVRQKPEYL